MKRLVAAALASLALFFSSAAPADVIPTTVRTTADGMVYLIENLLFQGTYYNVTFAYGTFYEAYGGHDNPFPGRLDAADPVAAALNTEPNALSIGPLGGQGGTYAFVPGFREYCEDSPVGLYCLMSGGQLLLSEPTCSLGQLTPWCEIGPFSWPTRSDPALWAVFTTPEPGTLALVALGLAGLAAARRRRR